MKMKKLFAAGLSVAMAMIMSLPVFAADPTTTVTAPIYSFEVLDVVVPTTYAVAFNPEGLTVKTGASDTSTAQILSKNYGMINKGNKDQIITVALTVADQNTGDDKVTFVDTKDEVDSAAAGEYKIHLTAVPADATEVKVSNASADKDTAAAAMNDVTMTKAADGKEVSLKAGENTLGFFLEKAVYAPKSGSEVTLGTTTSNDVASNFEISTLAAAGKGITAFTFGGEMNANANWTKLTSGIEITAVYSNAVAPSGTTAITGTGAMVTLTAAPTFTAGSDVGTIAYTTGTGDDGLKSITSMTMTKSGKSYDGYNAFTGAWAAATDEDGLITFDTVYTNTFARDFPNDATREVTITYVTNTDETKTATVNVKIRE